MIRYKFLFTQGLTKELFKDIGGTWSKLVKKYNPPAQQTFITLFLSPCTVVNPWCTMMHKPQYRPLLWHTVKKGRLLLNNRCMTQRELGQGSILGAVQDAKEVLRFSWEPGKSQESWVEYVISSRDTIDFKRESLDFTFLTNNSNLQSHGHIICRFLERPFWQQHGKWVGVGETGNKNTGRQIFQEGDLEQRRLNGEESGCEGIQKMGFRRL